MMRLNYCPAPYYYSTKWYIISYRRCFFIVTYSKTSTQIYVLHLSIYSCDVCMLPVLLPLKRWLRMCSKIAAKFTNSSEESSMGSAVYFSRRVFTENLEEKHREREREGNENNTRYRAEKNN